MNTQALDLATLPASPQQRRAALIAIAALGAIALVAAPFARDVLGTFPGFVTLYGGAVFTGLAITAMIILAQFGISRKPSLLVLACGTVFTVVVFVPYVLTFQVPGTSSIIPAHPSTSTYFWMLWHTVLPASFLAYAWVAAREGKRLSLIHI